MKTSDYSISAIVPVYNEVEVLESAISQIASFLGDHFADYEILIIESGSTDGTDKLCDRLAVTFCGITVLHEGKRAGFGSALRLGYEHAKKDLVWLVVVDMPFPLDTVLTALPLLSRYDCIFSYRSSDNRDFVKRLRSFIYNWLAKQILGLKVTHVNSAFRVFKREVIQSLPLISRDWTLDAEVLFEITRRGVIYAEIPVALEDRLRGKTSILLSDPISMIRSLLFIRWEKRRILKNES